MPIVIKVGYKKNYQLSIFFPVSLALGNVGFAAFPAHLSCFPKLAWRLV
jgi:hypothetical protein